MAETNVPTQTVDWFDREHKVITLFIDNAKTYVQLSIGALLLSVTFLREVLGLPKETPIHLDWALVVCWICFLMAVIFGALYQYFACKIRGVEGGREEESPQTDRVAYSPSM